MEYTHGYKVYEIELYIEYIHSHGHTHWAVSGR